MIRGGNYTHTVIVQTSHAREGTSNYKLLILLPPSPYRCKLGERWPKGLPIPIRLLVFRNGDHSSANPLGRAARHRSRRAMGAKTRLIATIGP